MDTAEDDYDPHVHRIERLKHPTNNVETIFHLIKGCLGTGVLAMPEAFKHTGMINGIVMFVIIAVFATYCIHVLIVSEPSERNCFCLTVLNLDKEVQELEDSREEKYKVDYLKY